jgi:arabinofuranosyltransferase
MSCGTLHELIESVRAPLTPSRFFENLFGSYGRTTLRIPTDPFKAEAMFCGHGKKN